MTDNNTVVVSTAVSKPTREFSTVESIFAWISLMAGYLFCRVFPVSNHSLGGFLTSENIPDCCKLSIPLAHLSLNLLCSLRFLS